MRRELPVLALLLSGCMTPGESFRGAVGARIGASAVEGRAALPGIPGTISGRTPAAAGGLSLDLLQDRWIGAFRSDTLFLPEDPEGTDARSATVLSWMAAAGPKVIETSDLRVDAFAGARATVLRFSDGSSGLPSDDIERESWVDPVAGLRAAVPLARGLSLRLRGEAALRNSEEDRAWRAEGAGTIEISSALSLSLGWEMSSIQRDRGSGGNRLLLDAFASGPFLAIELRF